MMKPRLVLQLISASVGLLCLRASLGAEVTRYLLTTPQGLPRSDIGVKFTADTLNLNGAITTQRVGDNTLVLPQLVSSYALAPDLKFESRATFSNLNRAFPTGGDAIETSLTAKSFIPMLGEIKGSVRRDTTGESRRKLRVNMKDTPVPSLLAKSLVFKANASVEEVSGKLPGTVQTGIETALVQRLTSNTTYNQLGFKYINQTGATQFQREAAAFSRSWAQNNVLRLGVEYELAHQDTSLQSTVRFTWKGFF